MEIVGPLVSALTRAVVVKLTAVLEKRRAQLKHLECDILFVKIELEMISGDMELQLSQKQRDKLLGFAQDMEDCLDRFLPCAACEGEPSAAIRDPTKLAKEIEKFRAYLEVVNKQKQDRDVTAGSSQPTEEETVQDLVGIEEPKQEILELLEAGEHLSVVSIVGFGGSGKTALARAVYQSDEVSLRFPGRAWAVASEHKDAKGLLTAILEELRPQEPAAVPKKQGEKLRHHMQATRCLVVIDDIGKQLWNAIKPIFPVETKSRILVTTSIQSVANACSSDYGHVYRMRALSTEHSKDLLNKNVFRSRCSPATEEGSTAIVDKCDGLPLALVSVVKVLQGENEPTGEYCQKISENLGERTAENGKGDFTRLRQVLMSSYSSMPDPVNPLGTCLMYTSLFPNGRPFSRKRLVRRLSAEGYVHPRGSLSALEVADENMKELIDRSIIRPIDVSNNARVKTCSPHSIMHQFMLHKAWCCNFIAHSGDGRPVRHLVIQNRENNPTDESLTAKKEIKQLRRRSLTIFGSAGVALSVLIQCELLRVLDLEECSDLEDKHLKYIYELMHLKYLGLGSPKVSRLTKKMGSLHSLETLDLRKTKIGTLPVEVLGLPHLAHLFGKVKLQLPQKTCDDENELKKILRGESSLQTVAGFVTDENHAFPQLMALLKKLRKVKIWFEPTRKDRNIRLVTEAIKKFVLDDMNTGVGFRSLSLHLNDYSEELLHPLDETEGYLSSLKLHGKLTRLPLFVLKLCGLRELCLTCTNLKGSDLSGLCTLRNLLYLKLVGVDQLDGLHINSGDLLSLLRLCLVVETPIFPRISEEALLTLNSLQLLCQGVVGLCGIKMEQFINLQEVALDFMVNTGTIQEWENAAKDHPKRPKVLLLKRVGQAETKYVANVGNHPTSV